LIGSHAASRCNSLSAPAQSGGFDVFCGAGAPACPAGSYCQIGNDIYGSYAVCCSNLVPPVTYSNSLPLYNPLPFYASANIYIPPANTIYTPPANTIYTPPANTFYSPPANAVYTPYVPPANAIYTPPTPSPALYPSAAQVYSSAVSASLYVPQQSASTTVYPAPVVQVVTAVQDTQEICPDTGIPAIPHCPTNPCLTATCYGVQGSSCMIDRCNNCGPKWYGPDDSVLTADQCNASPSSSSNSNSNQ